MPLPRPITTSLQDISYTGTVPGSIPTSSLFSFGIFDRLVCRPVVFYYELLVIGLVGFAGSG